MVYVIQCHAFPRNDSDLEKVRNHFLKQIREGCLVLPPNCSLVKVVKARSNNDVELIRGDGTTIDYVPVRK